MRAIIFDTETTGLECHKGDRVVEIGCIEILNMIPTGQVYHVYINPERDMPEDAFRVHGLSTEFLAGHKCFHEIVDEFLAFVGDDSKLIAHNATFDFGFLNAELGRCGKPPLSLDRMIDTLALARRKHGFASNRLDDLCTRYGINNSHRTKHGALLDAELLAEVYAELMGGRQAVLGLAVDARRMTGGQAEAIRARPVPLAPRLDSEDLAAHAAFVATMGDKALWSAYAEPVSNAAE
ncbi:DNA polymerase III subunit epsilon [Terrihabitans rhizophilus]|uniref:DNA polymerase III subunit epsilon n=1 Tax=Terrihabitans rhizophilus TaxID=3092662 RepID=A0ABU4RTR0_9HYPH|nr:DNA polymerase III subunit epsilon [Terrihabitans sp. PJ23]MDX6807528.1 DNA polymerase III subunit epsilon [Terrihabitans sp. PJ23]